MIPSFVFAESIFAERGAEGPVPELPEVEVTRRRIAPLLVGRRIARVETTADSAFFVTRPERLRSQLVRRQIDRLDRNGKYLVAGLDDGRRLVLHLGMTGQLFGAGVRSSRLLSGEDRKRFSAGDRSRVLPDAHTHLRLIFDDGGPEVSFRDVRKFGKVMLLAVGEASPRLDRVGADALDADADALWPRVHRRRTSIKNVLLDQSLFAGVGNIYADESLFFAGVRPRRAADRLTRREFDRLVTSVRSVLRRAIERGGSSIADFVAPDGADGAYQEERRVYARESLPCRACGTPVRRIVIQQRSAHYCPCCQR